MIGTFILHLLTCTFASFALLTHLSKNQFIIFEKDKKGKQGMDFIKKHI